MLILIMFMIPLKLGLEPVKAVFSATLVSAMGLMVKV
jgi:hypothetical protein